MKTATLHFILALAIILCLQLPSIAAHGGHEEPPPTSSNLTSNPNVPLAFGLVIVGGASTAIGGLVPLLGSRGVIPAFVESNLFLAGCMGLASGVLLFSSLYHILPETRESFAEGIPGHEELATLGSFFLGAFILMLVELLVHKLSPVHGSHDFRKYLFFSSSKKTEQRNSASTSSEVNRDEEVIPMADEEAAKVGCCFPLNHLTSNNLSSLIRSPQRQKQKVRNQVTLRSRRTLRKRRC